MKRVSIIVWLLGAGIFIPALIACSTVTAAEGSAPNDPAAKQAWELCEGQYRRCMNGESPGGSNPYSDTSCDIARAGGGMDPSTWEKCRDWCVKQRQQCRDKISEPSPATS